MLASLAIDLDLEIKFIAPSFCSVLQRKTHVSQQIRRKECHSLVADMITRGERQYFMHQN